MSVEKYYQDDTTTVYKGDCLDGLTKLINDGTKVDLTVTSPPYFNVKEYVEYENYKKYITFLEDVFTKLFQITNNGRMCVVNISNILITRKNRSSESKRIPLSFHFVSIMEKIGWEFLEDIIWLKPEGAAKNRNGGFFQHRQPVAYKPNVVNEYVFVFKKPSDCLIDKIVRSYSSLDSENSKVVEDYERSNVWKINPKTNSKHPAPYPMELTDKVIKYYSFVGDVIIDPFFGSGTTGLSCKRFHRKCIGFEIHDMYIDMFKSNISKMIPINIKNQVSLDSNIFADLTKDESIVKLKKYSKKLLFDILKTSHSNVKINTLKIDICNILYDHMVKET